MRPAVYDAGVLVAADRNVRAVWAEHRVRLEAGIVPVVPAPVVAQVSRSAAQVQLRRLLRGCKVTALTGEAAHAAGHLLGRAGGSDVVDAVVADTAARLRADVVTGDHVDISLSETSGVTHGHKWILAAPGSRAWRHGGAAPPASGEPVVW